MKDCEADRAVFAQAIAEAVLASGWKTPDKVKIEIYFKRLLDIPTHLVLAGIDECSKMNKGFPSVGAIREAIDELLDFKLVPPLPPGEKKEPPKLPGTVMEPDGTITHTYFCPACMDSGWITKTCPTTPCGRHYCVGAKPQTVTNVYGEQRTIDSHTFAVRCHAPVLALKGEPCYPNNPAVYGKRKDDPFTRRYSKRVKKAS